MSKYAKVAVNTVKYINENGGNPVLVWQQEANLIFGKHTSSVMKGCPKNAFLGLCEEGLIKGIPCGSYTKSIKNKRYAIKAVKLLKENPEYSIDKRKLWNEVTSNIKTHNSQMDVVCELFNSGYIV